jgi:PAS domain S-box-containing protein
MPDTHNPEHSEDTYGQIFARLQDGFFRVALDGEILAANAKSLRILGYEREDELLGTSVLDLYADPEQRAAMLAELRVQGEISAFQIRLRRKDGSIVHSEMSVVGIFDGQGNLVAQEGMIRDVSDRTRSEQQFRSLVKNSPGAIFRFIAGDSSHFSFMSDAIREISGYPADYFTTRTDPIQSITHPEDLQILQDLGESGFVTGENYSVDLRILTPAGETRWIQIRGSASEDPITGAATVDGLILDVTDLHQARAELERNEAMFRHLFDAMVEGYWVTDMEGRVLLANAAAVEILGFPDEATLLGTDSLAIMVNADQRAEFLEELVETRAVKSRTMSVRRYDQETMILEFSTRLTGHGRRTQAESTFRDVTRQKRIEAEILEARHAAEQANRAKSTFLANMSHELRTPLNAIIGYSEMLMEEAADLEEDVFTDDLIKIHAAGTHLLALINDVLDLSKVEAGKTELFAEEFSVAELISSVTSTIAPALEKNGNTLVLDLESDALQLHQDLTKLRQSLLNLLSNATKFTEHGTITLSSRAEEHDGEPWLMLAVKDTGIGIAPDKQQNLFQEFSQADPSTTRQFGGTGLGLAISRRFCQIMGGDISLHSVADEGSTFTIRVPAILTAPATRPESP